MKAQTFYCVYDPKGEIEWRSLNPKEITSIFVMRQYMAKSWTELESLGYTCKKVIIKPVK